MRKEYDVVVNERDILGTQLIRRNDELALLYEKVKIQQSTLLKGQVQYRDRVNEIRVLKLKLSDLKREVGVLRGSVQNIGEWRGARRRRKHGKHCGCALAMPRITALRNRFPC